MTSTMTEASLNGVTQGIANGIAENYDKLSDQAQASSKK